MMIIFVAWIYIIFVNTTGAAAGTGYPFFYDYRTLVRAYIVNTDTRAPTSTTTLQKQYSHSSPIEYFPSLGVNFFFFSNRYSPSVPVLRLAWPGLAWFGLFDTHYFGCPRTSAWMLVISISPFFSFLPLAQLLLAVLLFGWLAVAVLLLLLTLVAMDSLLLAQRQRASSFCSAIGSTTSVFSTIQWIHMCVYVRTTYDVAVVNAIITILQLCYSPLT